MVTYYAQFEPAEQGGFVITFPDFGWGVSQGEDEADALKMAAGLLESIINSDIRDSKDLPEPVVRRGRKYGALAGLQSAKVELYKAFHASGITKSDLARRTGIAKTNVDRLFNLRHASRLDQIDTAFRMLGKRLNITVETAQLHANGPSGRVSRAGNRARHPL